MMNQLVKNFPFIFKRKTIGIALSGGATLGAAHVGVLQVLEENGIKPDFVAGTSAGALVGAAYCAGIPLSEIETLFRSMSWPTLIKLSKRQSLSVFDTQPMEEFLRQKLGDIEFKDLNIPFAAICCDISNGERVVLEDGPLAPAVRASAAIPGLFSPVLINNLMLVDGGVVDNLPVEQVRAMGGKYLISSDVSHHIGQGKNPQSLFEVLVFMMTIMHNRSARPAEDQSNCYIRPEVSNFPPWGFKDSSLIIEAGREAGRGAVQQLRKELRLDG